MVTDPATELDHLATKENFRRVFRANPNLGGRYSALSHFGIVAGALLGVDIAELLRRSGAAIAAICPCVAPASNPALRFGAVLGGGEGWARQVHPGHAGGDRSFAVWLEQLIAESTGKHGVGILPVAGEDLGAPEVYGNDRVFVSLGKAAGLESLIAAGQPVVELDYVDRFSIGSEVVRWEYAIAMAGVVLGINPFDQPDVEAAKQAAATVLEQRMPTFRSSPRVGAVDGEAR